MTRMLASVANAAEAGVVVQLGADVVDLKDARQGALGGLIARYCAPGDRRGRGTKRNERGARRSALR